MDIVRVNIGWHYVGDNKLSPLREWITDVYPPVTLGVQQFTHVVKENQNKKARSKYQVGKTT